MTIAHYDLAIIGGGINGCGCAADAAERGLSVFLCEQGDLGQETSSKSTKLIHGGLRYLEHREFAMVRKSLIERQRLIALAPHLVKPLAIMIPYRPKMRPHWLLRTGLFIYDHLSLKNKLPKSRALNRRNNPAIFSALQDHVKRGLLFYDGKTDDSRLTLSNALQAKNHGADIQPRCRLKKAETHNHQWLLTLEHESGEVFQIRAKALVNASGPWVESVSRLLDVPLHHHMSLVKGSHILVPALYKGSQAYFLQHPDQRMVFVIPYHGYCMIGTTDIAFKGDPSEAAISEEEIAYLCQLVNTYFNQQITPEDVVSSWSGVRPLIAEEGERLQSLSRDYTFHYDTLPAPCLTIYGGKITTYRQLSEEVINALTTLFPKLHRSKSKTTPLPGAKFDDMDYLEYCEFAKKKYAWLDGAILDRYLSSYGCLTEKFLARAKNNGALGKSFGQGLYQIEVDYLVQEEWAQTPEDILWRRTKLGLDFTQEELKILQDYLSSLLSNSATMAETST